MILFGEVIALDMDGIHFSSEVLNFEEANLCSINRISFEPRICTLSSSFRGLLNDLLVLGEVSILSHQLRNVLMVLAITIVLFLVVLTLVFSVK